ncbi:hypothetical protein [Pedobacter cryoconitis]|uniref:Uncharacterized protein n=1 Tax=Pedobacter cryoconitis TaxID=188932 RepID=A0A327S792_9SPHI|nr:hypothetical protein [Pedobacter cryoconitis]RAJ24950.1 hypothetical protein LY11_04308 [Pedobacter cryoconitis]
MKTVTFSFDHPVAVKVFFNCISDPQLKQDIKFLRSDEWGLLHVPVDDIPKGVWKLVLEWNYEDRDFCMERIFESPGAVL